MTSKIQKENDADFSLLRAAGEGDKQAFSALYRRYYPLLTRFAYRYLKDVGFIEEVVNDTLLTVWQKADEFRGDSRVSTWIMGIAMRKCWHQARKNSRLEESGEELSDQGVEDPALQRFDDQQQIERAMNTLSRDHRVCVELAYYSGYTCEEIGQIVGCSPNTVKTRLFYARKAFRKSFDNDYEMQGMQQGENTS